MTPDTHDTRCGTVNIAYQVIGSGPPDIVFVPGWVSNIEIFWEEPRLARFLSRIASCSRLILFDNRGTGLSDRLTVTPTLEERMEDLRAVMDAVGSAKAFVIGHSEGGPMSALFAATYPERVGGLIMIGSYPRRTRCAEFPYGPTEQEIEALLASLEERWGTADALQTRAPSVIDDPAFCKWWARHQRMSTSPAAAVAITRANAQIDVRDILPTIRIPTVIIHARNDLAQPIEFGRFLAARIPGAKLVEIESADHLFWLEGADEIFAAIKEFVTGAKPAAEIRRMLSTILFTDIVASTEQMARLGDSKWSNLLSAHNRAVRSELDAFGGKEVNTTGDGFVVTFEGPARAIKCAAAIRKDLRQLGIEIRAGIHS